MLHIDGYRPIHRACWGSTPNHTETLFALLRIGQVDPDVTTEMGHQAATFASMQAGESCLDMAGSIDSYNLVTQWKAQLKYIEEQKSEIRRLADEQEVLLQEQGALLLQQQGGGSGSLEEIQFLLKDIVGLDESD